MFSFQGLDFMVRHQVNIEILIDMILFDVSLEFIMFSPNLAQLKEQNVLNVDC